MSAPLPPSLIPLAPSQTAPQFGGGSLGQRLGNGTIHLFDAINKEYLYEFFALDIVALWITRIVTGLVVGRITYNALNQPNPTANADTPFELWRHNLTDNIKGLNWGNAWEILKREALTGPGCLLLPSLAYSAARQLTHNHSQDMQYGWFKKLHFAFQAGVDAARSIPEGTSLSSSTLVRNTIKQLFNPMAANDELDALRNVQLIDSTMLRQKPRSHIQLKNPDNRSLESILNNYGSSSKITTMGDFLDAWGQRYATQVDAIINDKSLNRSDARKELSKLATTLGDDLDAVMRGVSRHNSSAFQHVVYEGRIPLRELTSTTPLFKQQSTLTLKEAIKEGGIAIESLTHNLGQFADYWLDMLPKANSAPSSVTQLLEQSSHYMNRVIRNKGLTTLIGMVIGGSWLYFLPRLTQDGKSYPAARLFQQAGLNVTGANGGIVSNEELQRLATTPALNPLWRLGHATPNGRLSV